jgi:hypothetical protein
MIFDMVVQLLDSSKDTIARADLSSELFNRDAQMRHSPSNFVVPSANSNLIQVFRSLLLACFSFDSW